MIAMGNHLFSDENARQKRLIYSFWNLDSVFLMLVDCNAKKYALTCRGESVRFAILKDDALPDGIVSVPVVDYSSAFVLCEPTADEMRMRDAAIKLFARKIVETNNVKRDDEQQRTKCERQRIKCQRSDETHANSVTGAVELE